MKKEKTGFKRFVAKIAVGVACGVCACAVQMLIDRYAGLGYSIGIRIVGVIVAAFFFGMIPGIVASVLTVTFGAVWGWMVGGATLSLSAALSSAFASLAALGLVRFTLCDRRPCATSAAFYAMLVAMVQLSVVFICGVGHLQETIHGIRNCALPMVGVCALSAAVAAFALRVPSDRVSARRCLYALLSFVLLTVAVWIAESRACLAVGRAEMNVLGETLVTEIDYLVEPLVFRMAQAVVDEAGSLEKALKTKPEEWARDLHVSRVSFADEKGVIVASSDPKAIGADYRKSDSAKELLGRIYDEGARYASVRFRHALSGSDDQRFFKYVAIAFPDRKGCVIVGDDLSDYDKRFDYIYELAMVDWPAGENGTYVLVNPKTGTVLSAITADWIGRPFSDTGLDRIKPSPKSTEVRATVMGIDGYVRKLPVEFANLDAYLVLPVDEVMMTRNLSVVVFAMAFTLIFIFGSMLLSKIFRQQESIREFYAREEDRRSKDLKLAQDIQISAMPSNFTPFPGISGLDLCARMRTAKEVGGDFFDFFPHGDNRLFLVIADVSGKGVPAALFMMKTKAALRAAARPGVPLPEVMAEANESLCADNTSDMFVTVWIGVYDLVTGEIEYVSAGHNPPYIRRANGTVEQVKSPRALVLAAMPGIRYRSSKVSLGVGDRLVLYTDGVTEAVSAGHVLFGEPRLESALANCDGSAAVTCDRMIEKIDEFAGEEPQADDITVLVLVRNNTIQE